MAAVSFITGGTRGIGLALAMVTGAAMYSVGTRVMRRRRQVIRRGLDGRIAALEDRFGLTPKARLDLGVTYSEAHDALGELERRIEEAFADDQAPDDPRLRAVTAETTAEEKAG